MKILIISHSYLSEENRKNLEELGKRASVRVISPSKMGDNIHSYNLSNRKVEGNRWRIYLRDKIEILRNKKLYILSGVKEVIKKFSPDIVNIEYDIWSPISIQSIILSKIFSKSKIVCTIKKNTYDTKNVSKVLAKDTISLILKNFVDSYISVGRGVRDIYEKRFGIPREKLSICTHLGVDTDTFKNRGGEEKSTFERISERNGAFLVGYTGRLDRDKGVTDLFSAIEIARQRSGKNIHLAFLGSGKLETKLRQMSERRSWFHVCKSVPHAQVAGFLNLLDLFVLPSRIRQDHEEHDAHSLLEALSCGVPCIGTRSGVIPEILEGVGPVVEPQEPKEIARNVADIMDNNGRRRMISEKGRKLILDRYSIEAVADKKYSIFESVLGK